MNATTVATAGVQPGDTQRLRAFVSRFEKARDHALLDRMVRALESAGAQGRALELHRTARDRLRAELGL